MSLKQYKKNARILSEVPTNPTTPVRDKPCLIGDIPGFYLDKGVETEGAYKMDVLGPIALGKSLYYDTATDGITNVATNNTFYGYALEAIAGATTEEIPVLIGR